MGLRNILSVFTKSYKEDVAQQLYLESHLDKVKLEASGYDIDDAIERLKANPDIVPKFRIKPIFYGTKNDKGSKIIEEDIEK